MVALHTFQPDRNDPSVRYRARLTRIYDSVNKPHRKPLAVEFGNLHKYFWGHETY